MAVNWADPQIWVLVSFLLFVGFVGVPAVRKAKYQLDQRSHMISRQVREVADLYEETQYLLEKQRKEFSSVNNLINHIKMETEQEIEALEKDKQIHMNAIKKAHNSRLEKQIKLVKEQYIDDIVKQALDDVTKIVQSYLEQDLSKKEIQSYNDAAIESVNFVKPNELRE